jgi:hypothetical protein
MAKRQTLLFELLKEDEKDQPKGLWDHLFRKKDSPEQTPPVATIENKSETTVTATPEDSYNKDELGSLGKTRLYLRLNLYSLILAVTALLVVFFCAYITGKSIGYREGTRQRSDLQLAEIQDKPVQNEVLDLFPEKKTATAPSPLPAAASDGKVPESADIFKNDNKITRKTGSNYLIIQIFELTDEPIARLAQKYLADQGVDSTLERAGRSYKLISAAGFESGDPQKDSFKAQIEALGQQFRQQRNAYGVSFKGCYYEKWK